MNNHWKQVILSEICSVSAGNSAPQDPSYFAEGTIPFFRTSDAGRIKFGTIYESQDKLNSHGASKLRRYPAGTILFPKSGASTFLNHRVLLGVEGCVSSHLATIVPNLDHALPQFLLYALTLIDAKDLIQDQSYPSLNLPAIENIRIYLPPLDEQQQIVRLLDEAFEGIAIAKANVEKNLQNARALFESHLQSIFTKSGNGWKNKALEEVCEFSNGLWKGEKPPFEQVGVIRNTNFTKNGMLDDSDIAFLDVEVKKLEKRRLKYGDIILEKSGGGPKQAVGRVALFEKEAGAFSFSNFTAALRVIDSGTVDFRFLHKFLHWTYLSGATEGMQSNSTGIRNLDGDAYKSIRFNFPPLAEQQQIASLLDELQVITDGLARICTAKQALLEDLKESLLHQAFSGNLEAA